MNGESLGKLAGMGLTAEATDSPGELCAPPKVEQWVSMLSCHMDRLAKVSKLTIPAVTCRTLGRLVVQQLSNYRYSRFPPRPTGRAFPKRPFVSTTDVVEAAVRHIKAVWAPDPQG